jgi:hypothetical protein
LKEIGFINLLTLVISKTRIFTYLGWKWNSSSSKSMKTSTQSVERSSTLSSKTHRIVKCGTDSISENESFHDEVKQAKDPCRETSQMERFRKDESFSPVRITDLDTMDQIESPQLIKETASSTGDNNNGCGPNGMGNNTIINIFYPDASRNYQKVQSLDTNNVAGYQQQAAISGYPQSFGGFCPNYSFQQMEHYPDPYGQYNSLLQYQPPSCGGYPLPLPSLSFDSYRYPEYPNLLG